MPLDRGQPRFADEGAIMCLTLSDELLNVLYRYANLILIEQLLVISE